MLHINNAEPMEAPLEPSGKSDDDDDASADDGLSSLSASSHPAAGAPSPRPVPAAAVRPAPAARTAAAAVPNPAPPRAAAATPDPLTLDLRSYATLAGAIVDVKLFLARARRLAPRPDPRNPNLAPRPDPDGQLWATLLLGGRDLAKQGALHSVLQKIFRNRHIDFGYVEREGALRVDVLSGLRDDEEAGGENNNGEVRGNRRRVGGEGRPATWVNNSGEARPAGARDYIVRGERAPHPRELHPNIPPPLPPPQRNASMMRSHHGSADRTPPPPTTLHANVQSLGNTSSLGEGSYRHTRAVVAPGAGAGMPSELGRGAAGSHWARLEAGRDGEGGGYPDNHHPRTDERGPLPPSTSPVELLPHDNVDSLPASMRRREAGPQDPGAGRLYNPFDAVARTLLARDASGDSGDSPASNPYYNALSGVPVAAPAGRGREGRGGAAPPPNHAPPMDGEGAASAASRPEPERSTAGGRDDGAPPPPEGPPLQRRSTSGGMHRYYDIAMGQGPQGTNGAQRLRDLLLSPASPEEAALRAAMLAHPPSQSNHGSGSSNSNRSAPRSRRHRSQRDESRDLRRAVAASQAAHIAHTRDRVERDIRFRRAMEMAAAASREEAAANSANNSGSHSDEERLLQMARRRSLADEAEEREARRKRDRELEWALQSSERLAVEARAEDERLQRSEEELVQDLLARTEADARDERRGEEAVLQRALERSRDDTKVSEDELVEDAVRESLDEAMAAEEERTGDEEVLRAALRLSLEEERRAEREEEEELRRALEWSRREAARGD